MIDRLMVAGGVAGAAAAGAWVVQRARARRTTFAPSVDVLPQELLPDAARDRLVVLGFTSRFCAACRRTPDVVGEALDDVEGDVGFVPVDVAHRSDLARTLGLRETPTVLLVDPEGRVRYAVEGNPEPAEVRFFVEEAQASLEDDETPGILSAMQRGMGFEP